MRQPISRVRDCDGGDVMIVNVETGNYYVLSGVAADVWSMIERGSSHEAILDEVCAAHRGEPNEMRATIAGLMNELVQEGLVATRIHDAVDPVASSSSRGTDVPPTFTAPVLEKHTDMRELLQAVAKTA